MMQSDDAPLGSLANMPASSPAMRVGQGDSLGAALDRMALGRGGARGVHVASGHTHVSVAHQVAAVLSSGGAAGRAASHRR